MPVIGTGTFLPQSGFNFPRSYVSSIAFPSDWTLESHAGNEFVFNDFLFYNDRIFVNLYENFWPWSSNVYSLDHIVVDCYYHALPSPVDLPTPFSLTWLPGTTANNGKLVFLSPFFGSSVQTFALPAAPSSYWLPAR